MRTDPIEPHQIEGIDAILKNRSFALFDDPGGQKSRQVIQAANVMFSNNQIDRVLIICPSQLLFNWYNNEVGELENWGSTCKRVLDVGGDRTWRTGEAKDTWMIVTFEWMRTGLNVLKVVELVRDSKFMLVIDEGSFIGNRTTKQFKATLGPRYGRVKVGGRWKDIPNVKPYRTVLLNGTPTGNCMMELWSQFYALDKNILDCPYQEFEARFAIKGGFQGREIIGYRDLDGTPIRKDQVPTRFLDSLRAHLLCRDKRVALPSLKAPETRVVTVPMTGEQWTQYKLLRDAFLIDLEKADEDIPPNAGVHALRLWQYCQGFTTEKRDSPTRKPEVFPVWHHHIKTEWLVRELKKVHGDVIVWAWFHAQIDDIVEQLNAQCRLWHVWCVDGRTSKKDREEAIREFHPLTEHYLKGQHIMVMQEAAGGFGLNLAKASTSIYLSCNASAKVKEQTDNRIDRSGQTNTPLLVDVLLTGPKGQKTQDVTLFNMRQRRENFNRWTKARWRRELRD